MNALASWLDARLPPTHTAHHTGYCCRQVEQHIRRNALRLNLADRLNGADAPSSDISSEVGLLLSRHMPAVHRYSTGPGGQPTISML